MLYDWLLKNKYADAALIAKWKKQGYEKVCGAFNVVDFYLTDMMSNSSAACAAFRRKKPISTAHASVACPATS